jgi:hypothetical protein
MLDTPGCTLRIFRNSEIGAPPIQVISKYGWASPPVCVVVKPQTSELKVKYQGHGPTFGASHPKVPVIAMPLAARSSSAKRLKPVRRCTATEGEAPSSTVMAGTGVIVACCATALLAETPNTSALRSTASKPDGPAGCLTSARIPYPRNRMIGDA